MSTKACSITIELDVHAVTCPGVWLSTCGQVSLQITIFGETLTTSKQDPIYPLLLHETFSYVNTFNSVRNLEELQNLLRRRNMYAKLLQWTSHNKCVVLATFETTLQQLLYPSPQHKGVLPGVDIDLLMDPTPNYPGILGPKIEISTKTTIADIKTSCKCDDASFLNHLTITTKSPLLSNTPRLGKEPPVSARQGRAGGKQQQRMAERVDCSQECPCVLSETYAEWDVPCMDTLEHDSNNCFLCRQYKCDTQVDCPCCLARRPTLSPVCNVRLELSEEDPCTSCTRATRNSKENRKTDGLHRRVEEVTDPTKYYPFLEDKERNPPSCYCDPMPIGGRRRRRLCPSDCPPPPVTEPRSCFYEELSQMYKTLYDQYKDETPRN